MFVIIIREIIFLHQWPPLRKKNDFTCAYIHIADMHSNNVANVLVGVLKAVIGIQESGHVVRMTNINPFKKDYPTSFSPFVGQTVTYLTSNTHA